MDDKNQECCPLFRPEKWDNKTFTWENKTFIKDAMPTLFHIPFPPMINKKMTKLWNMVEKSNKMEVNKDDTLILFHDPSPFMSEIFISTVGPVPQANNINLTGTFVAKVFDGNYSDVPKFMKLMDEYLSKEGKKAKDYFIHYAYCPKCAKKYGNNYMIFFAQI